MIISVEVNVHNWSLCEAITVAMVFLVPIIHVEEWNGVEVQEHKMSLRRKNDSVVICNERWIRII